MTKAATDAVLTLFLVMGTGFLLKKTGVIQKGFEQFTVAFLKQAAIPALLLHTLLTRFERSFLEENYPALLAAFLTILGAVIAGLLISRLFRIPLASQGIFTVMVAFSNTALLGIPLITGVFGEGGLPWLMLYHLMNSLLFWTVGIWLISGDEGAGFLSLSSLQKISSPPVLAFLLGIVLLYRGIVLPDPVLEALGWLKDTVTPLTTLYLGAVIADLSLKKLPGLKVTLLILAGRILLSPFIAWAVLSLFGFSGPGAQVMIIASHLPVMTEISVMAGHYGKDLQYAAFMTALTALLSILTIPLFLDLL